MKTKSKIINKIHLLVGCIFIAFSGFAQTQITPQVNFTQRTSSASPTKKIYNIKGDFTLLGNTNLTLTSYSASKDNEANAMKYVDIDGDANTLNSSMATLELSNSGENSASQSCSTILYAGLYWTGKSDDTHETFSVTKGSVTKNYNKKVVSIKGPGDNTYTTITAKTNGASSDIWFPGANQSGIFIGYQEITDYVKAHGAGAYTVADLALIEGTNSVPGYSGGWGMVVIYENPSMKSRAVTLFDGYDNINGQATGGQYGLIPISGFTTAGSGAVNMKLGVMAAEGDVALSGDYLAVQKLNANSAVYPGSYSILNHAANSSTNFFNSSIFPIPATGKSNPNLVNNTGIDLSMFTIPNSLNSVIGNNQTSTTFRFGSSSDIFTIFGFAMSVDAYVPDPKVLTTINSINNVTNPITLTALPGQAINYSLKITNEGTETTNNSIISIPVPATTIFHTGTIVTHTYYGFSPGTTPYFDSATNKIIWNLGTLPTTAGHPEYIYADLSFTLDVTSDCNTILNSGCNPEVTLETGVITGTGTISGSSFTKNFFQGYDTSICHLPITGSIKVAINTTSCIAAMAGVDQIASCGLESVTLAATGSAGSWSVVNGPSGGGEILSNNTSQSSNFYSPNYGTYTLRWTTTCGATDDVVITFAPCENINFDGVDDNINFKNKFDLSNGNFSLEAWIKPNSYNSNTQTIISKRNSPNSSDGYDLRLVNNILSFNWNTNSITAIHPIDINRWYHVSVTFDGTNYKLYIDGIAEKTGTGINPTSNNADFIMGAMSQINTTPNNFYNGWLDEVRIWNVSLTVDQIRQTMNQEITYDNNGIVQGSIIPKNINGLSWSNLKGYYQLNSNTDIDTGNLLDISSNSVNGKLINIYTQQDETAPIPYTTRLDGSWETDSNWSNFSVLDVPNSVGIDGVTKIDWNIAITSNFISSYGNKTLLGLIVDTRTLSIANDSKLEISSYLKLDGIIDLKGLSQLVQTAGSDLDVNSAGYIQKNQQGQSNLFNYNYWSSPVSPINTVANNSNYSITEVMKDGTTSTPQNMNWIGGYNGAPTAPLSIARYWLFTFDNYSKAYANWNQIRETTPIRVGQGYTMKGSGAEGSLQNYTFVGKPNNGIITTNSVAPNNLLLTGNPYPSALDANAFILDNSDSIDGNLYFWEHYSTNNTHVLRDYQGGYAVRNLTGGVAPTSAGIDYISGLGTSSRGIPNQFIPVGQGFFVTGKSNGNSTIVFNNGQRSFHKENETSVSNVMYKVAENSKKSPKSAVNSNDYIATSDNLKRIRLGYNANNMYHRQVLLGFMNEKATSEIDYGYDGFNKDNFSNDMYLLNGNRQLVIEGEGYFDINASYPIGVKASVNGKVSFMIDAIENFDNQQPVFIYDSLTDTYHDIRTQSFDVTIPVGKDNSRFFLRFKDKTLSVNKNIASDNEIKITHIQNGNTLVINNQILDVSVEKVTLFNLLGQSVVSWKTENLNQQNIQLPINTENAGVYIVKLKTTNGELSKKIIIN